MNLFEIQQRAREVARKAGEEFKKAFFLPKVVSHKGRQDLVTETDKKIEEFLKQELAHHFPSHRFLGEEGVAAQGGREELSADPTWIVDPIDGTTNFVHSIPYCCISMALAVEREAVVGLVYNPVTSEMFTAIRGHGAFLNDAPLSVSRNHALLDAIASTGIPQDKSLFKEVVQGNLWMVQNHCRGLLLLLLSLLSLSLPSSPSSPIPCRTFLSSLQR